MERSKTDKRARFRNLAPKRVEKALRAIHNLGQCGNRTNYEFGDVERDAIFARIESAVAAARSRFDPPIPKPRGGRDHAFELPLLDGVDEAGAS